MCSRNLGRCGTAAPGRYSLRRAVLGHSSCKRVDDSRWSSSGVSSLMQCSAASAATVLSSLHTSLPRQSWSAAGALTARELTGRKQLL